MGNSTNESEVKIIDRFEHNKVYLKLLGNKQKA